MKKILHIIDSCDPKTGGPIEGIKQINKQYKKHNIEAHLLTSDKKEDKFLNDNKLPKVYPLGPRLFKYGINFKMYLWLKKNIKNYDLLIVDGIWQFHNYAVWKIAKKYNIPYFVFVHGMLDPWFNKNYYFKHIKKIFYWFLFQHKFLKDSHKVLFTSEIESNLAKKSFFPYNIKNHVVGYGIEGNSYLKSNKNFFLKKYKNLKNKKILLYLGRITEKKGLDLLLFAFNKIKENNLHLVIAGSNNANYFKKIEQIIIKLNLKKFTTFTGPLYNRLKWDAYKTADLFCLPSHQENFGITIAESLSSGTPVLISNKINIYKTIKKFNCGFVNDDTIKGTLKSLTLWKKFSKNKYDFKKNSLNCFKKNFDISIFIKKYFKLIYKY